MGRHAVPFESPPWSAATQAEPVSPPPARPAPQAWSCKPPRRRKQFRQAKSAQLSARRLLRTKVANRGSLFRALISITVVFARYRVSILILPRCAPGGTARGQILLDRRVVRRSLGISRGL